MPLQEQVTYSKQRLTSAKAGYVRARPISAPDLSIFTSSSSSFIQLGQTKVRNKEDRSTPSYDDVTGRFCAWKSKSEHKLRGLTKFLYYFI